MGAVDSTSMFCLTKRIIKMTNILTLGINIFSCIVDTIIKKKVGLDETIPWKFRIQLHTYPRKLSNDFINKWYL